MTYKDPQAGALKTAPHSLGVRVEDFLRHGWPAVLILIGSLAIGVASTPELIEGLQKKSSDRSFAWGSWGWPQIVFLVGLVGILIGTIAQLCMTPSVTRMDHARQSAEQNSRNQALAVEGVLRAVIADMQRSMKLEQPEVRFSVYGHVAREFVLLARLSANPAFSYRGRKSYPEDQGVIGQAWAKGSTVVTGLEGDRKSWETQLLERYKMPRDVTHVLSMQSKSLVARRIESPGDHQPIGMLVIESTRSKGVTSKTLDDIDLQPSWGILRRAISNAHAYVTVVASGLQENHELGVLK